MKIAFVILNYGTYQETTECVNSIQRHIDVSETEYNITIVDNGSKDDSLKKLQKAYINIENIDVIPVGENLGFARGNNVGITYVNKNYNPEFVIALNSDTELFQDDLYSKISFEYKHSKFALLGPMMLIAEGRCDDSPWKPIDIKSVEEKLKYYKDEKKAIESGLIYFSKIKRILKRLVGLEKGYIDRFHVHEPFWKYQTGVELQGACIVFSREFFKYENGFDARTFLYYEEQLLYLSAVRHGLTVVYDPRVAVFHKDGRTTKKIKASREKYKFINQCNIESLEILLETMYADGMK